jgi:hypothetical protein
MRQMDEFPKALAEWADDYCTLRMVRGRPVMMSEFLTGLIWELAEKLQQYNDTDRLLVRAEINRVLDGVEHVASGDLN